MMCHSSEGELEVFRCLENQCLSFCCQVHDDTYRCSNTTLLKRLMCQSMEESIWLLETQFVQVPFLRGNTSAQQYSGRNALFILINCFGLTCLNEFLTYDCSVSSSRSNTRRTSGSTKQQQLMRCQDKYCLDFKPGEF